MGKSIIIIVIINSNAILLHLSDFIWSLDFFFLVWSSIAQPFSWVWHKLKTEKLRARNTRLSYLVAQQQQQQQTSCLARYQFVCVCVCVSFFNHFDPSIQSKSKFNKTHKQTNKQQAKEEKIQVNSKLKLKLKVKLTGFFSSFMFIELTTRW